MHCNVFSQFSTCHLTLLMTFLDEQKFFNFNTVKFISLFMYSLVCFFTLRFKRYFSVFFCYAFWSFVFVFISLVHQDWNLAMKWDRVLFVSFFPCKYPFFSSSIYEQALVFFTDHTFHLYPNPKFHIVTGLFVLFLVYSINQFAYLCTNTYYFITIVS